MDLMASLMITAIVYLFVPVILLIAPITDRTWSLSTIKKIVIINGVCCWLLFSIVSIETGGNGAGPALFFWSWIAYKMLKKKLVTTKPNTDTDKPQEKDEYIDLANKLNRIARIRREIDDVLAKQYNAATNGDSALAQQLFDRYIFLLSELETAKKNSDSNIKDEEHHD